MGRYTQIIHHTTRKPLADLDDAIKVGYHHAMNEAWTASFSLPYNSENNAFCEPFALVRVQDDRRDYGLYRIGPQELTKSGTGQINFECEHVITTLFNDTMLGFHQVGNLGTYTRTVIEYILSFQTIQNWVLGDCEFERQFEYCWENQTLLSALWSVTNPFSEPYHWVFETDVPAGQPWILHLRKLNMSAKPQCYARTGEGGNIRAITRRVDTSNLCTDLVPFGYGEGPNQLNVSSVNNGSMIIRAPQEVRDKYPPVTIVWVDRRYQDAGSLFAAGQALMEEISKPRLEYELDAIDLYPITDDPLDQFDEGKLIRVQDDDTGEDLYSIVKSAGKDDIIGKPGSIKITIANTPTDIAGNMADLADRQRIEQLYAQGACCPDTQNFSDNADPTHPAVMRFWVDDDAIRINKIMLVFELDYFRGTAKGVAAAAQTSSTSSSQPAQTSSEGGGTYNSSTGSGGGSNTNQTSGPSSATSSGSLYLPIALPIVTDSTTASSGTAHNHPISGITSAMTSLSQHTHAIGHTHTFTISVDAHAHSFSVGPHAHTIPGHSHQVPIPAHNHLMEYGIYQGRKASSAAVYVDGRLVLMAPRETVDVAPYLAVDGSGRITRGTFHVIQIVPNDQTYINATGISYVFTSPRTGGDH